MCEQKHSALTELEVGPGAHASISPHPSKTLSVLQEAWCGNSMHCMLSKPIVCIYSRIIQYKSVNKIYFVTCHGKGKLNKGFYFGAVVHS